MRAATAARYGGPEVFTVQEVDAPRLAERDVLIEVQAADITAGDRRIRAADYPSFTSVLGRLAMGVFGPRNKIQGSMIAGRVVRVGSAVKRFSVGDRVFGAAMNGGYAEYVAMREDAPLALLPDHLSFDEGAALPYGAGTAIHFLERIAHTQPGERVLIVGASGGVGRFAIQVAKHLGADVTAIGGAGGLQGMRDLGADRAFDYKTYDAHAAGETYDIIFDIVGATSYRESRELLSPGGRFLTLMLTLGILLQSVRASWFHDTKAHFAIAMDDQAGMEYIAEWVRSRAIAPRVAHRFPLDEIALAHQTAERDRASGSTVITKRAA